MWLTNLPTLKILKQPEMKEPWGKWDVRKWTAHLAGGPKVKEHS